MKTRTCASTAVLFLTVAALSIFISCENIITPTLVGTWINADYDGGAGGNAGKAVVTHVEGNDYIWTMYTNHDDTVPAGTVNFTVTSESTDSEGNLIAKTISYPGDPEYVYSLCKVHADNQIFEGNASEFDYPTEINPSGADYFIMYRQ